MTKKCLMFIASMFVIHSATAQSLAINTDGSNADASALLDVKSTVKGVLIPRMTKAERMSIALPATGLMVFQNAPDSAGFYYYDGTAWNWMASINGNADTLAWKRNGNAGTNTATHFIGTTDNQVLNFKVNNTKSGLIDNVNYNSSFGFSSLPVNSAGTHNTAIGFQAMNNNNANYNTAVGAFSSFNNSAGIRNTAIGTSALFFNTANDNTAVGYEALNQTFGTTSKNNTAVGSNALRNNSSGTANTALGDSAGYAATSASYNVTIGKNAGRDNTGSNNVFVGSDAGSKSFVSGNVFVGDSSGARNTFGTANVFVGENAGRNSTTASNNSFYGSAAGQSNTTGGGNSFFGRNAGSSNTGGSSNIGIGFSALSNNTTGFQNIAIGLGALYDNTNKSNLVAIGDSALARNGTGATTFQAVNNTAIGSRSLLSNTTATDNTAIGYQAMEKNTTSSNNTYIGSLAGKNAVTGGATTLVGSNAGNNLKQTISTVVVGAYAFNSSDTSSYNVAVGSSAASSYIKGEKNVFVGYNTALGLKIGEQNTVMGYQASVGDTADLSVCIGSFAGCRGDENIFIGHDAGKHNNLATMNNSTYIGSWAGFFKRANNSVLLGASSSFSVDGAYTNAMALGYATQVDASNKVRVGNTSVSSIGGQVGWSTFSDGRYKEEIKNDIPGIEFIKRLKPVSYIVNINSLNKNYYKLTATDDLPFSQRQTGFIAQDVEKAAQDLNFTFSGVDKPQAKDGLYGLRYADFVVPLVKGMQEQQMQIEDLKRKVAELTTLLKNSLQK